jgi:hypothetical protein
MTKEALELRLNYDARPLEMVYKQVDSATPSSSGLWVTLSRLRVVRSRFSSDSLLVSLVRQYHQGRT